MAKIFLSGNVTPGAAAASLTATSCAGKLGRLIITTGGNSGYFWLANTADIATAGKRVAIGPNVTIDMGQVDPADLSVITGSAPPYCSFMFILE